MRSNSNANQWQCIEMALLLGKLEAYSVLHTTYSWVHRTQDNSKNFTILQGARTDQCVDPGE